MIDKRKIWLRVLHCWIHVLILFFCFALMLAVLLAIVSRFGAGRAIIGILLGGAGVGLFFFVMQMFVVKLITAAELPTKDEYPLLFIAWERALRQKWRFPPFFIRPRLYIASMMEMPNAFAFGPGFFGFYGVAITPQLYQLLTRNEYQGFDIKELRELLTSVELQRLEAEAKEVAVSEEMLIEALRTRKLEAVLLHEIAHIRSKDIGLMTLLAIMTGGTEQLGRLFLGGKTALGRTLLATSLGYFFLLFSKFVFPIGRAALQVLREYSADALAALWQGTSQPLIEALEELAREFKRIRPPDSDSRHPLESLMITHPKMELRLAALRSYEILKG